MKGENTALELEPGADEVGPIDVPTEPTPPLEESLSRRLSVPVRLGEPVTPELVATYSTLLLYAANMTGVRMEELQHRDLLAQITARFAWPHPLRRATDRRPGGVPAFLK